jgi:Tfp pilus assembly protein PilV
MLIISIMRINAQKQSGATLPELMISAVLIAVFFASMFEVNAVCLRYVEASKEAVSAIQGVQDRLETLRNMAFSDLTEPNDVKALMVNPSNVSDLARRVTETVTITAYDTDSAVGGTIGAPVVITRPAGATSTPSISGSSTSIATANAVLVEVRYDWAATLAGGRFRSERTSSIISAGVKK